MKKIPTPYHRGNLEVVLLEKAAEIIALKGVEGLSLRELGRVAEVSRAAPYHYFKDKSALLNRLGQLGFERLGLRISFESTAEIPPLQRLQAGFRGYLSFAIEQPNFFRLMFRGLLLRSKSYDGGDVGMPIQFSSTQALNAFKVLNENVIHLQQAGVLKPSDSLLLVNVLWSFTHGVAVLAIDDNLKQRDALSVFNAGIEALLASFAKAGEHR